MEADAVGAGDKCRDTAGSGHSRDARHVPIPLRIEHAAVVAAPGGDFTGWEDDEHVALLHPLQGFADASAICLLVALAHHVVNQNAATGKLFHASEQLVGKEFDV